SLATQRIVDLGGVLASKLQGERRNREVALHLPAGRGQAAQELIDIDIMNGSPHASAHIRAVQAEPRVAGPLDGANLQLRARNIQLDGWAAEDAGHAECGLCATGERKFVVLLIADQDVVKLEFSRTVESPIQVSTNRNF